jgi:hypothetical protein
MRRVERIFRFFQVRLCEFLSNRFLSGEFHAEARNAIRIKGFAEPVDAYEVDAGGTEVPACVQTALTVDLALAAATGFQAR